MRNILSLAALTGLGFGFASASAATAPAAPLMSTSTVAVTAVAQDEEEDRRRKRQTLSTTVAKRLGEAFDLANQEPPQYQGALNILNQLMGREMNGYDRSTVLEVRGGVYAALENYAASLNDYVEVLRIDALPFERLRQIRYNVAQLYFVNADYDQAIRFMREYLEGVGGNIEDANAWYILAAAYVAKDNPTRADYQNARRPAENVIRYDNKRQKKNYDLLNLIYSELGLDVERGRLLEQMIEYFPNEESYWAQLSGAYSTAGRDTDAFATLEVAYKAGLVVDEDKIIALAQYYSALDNPFRGAKLVEAEMANGVIQRTLKNYELLAQLWSMARNQPKAIEALTAAARISDRGELYYRLGQSYMADEDFSNAVRNLRLALQKGGLARNDQGDIYLLMGAALFNIDSETRSGRLAARREFVRAANYPRARRDARGWIQYIDAIEDTLRAQAEVERAQRITELLNQIDRCESLIDVAELGGGVDEERIAECRALIPEAQAEIANLEGNGATDDGTLGQDESADEAEAESDEG